MKRLFYCLSAVALLASCDKADVEEPINPELGLLGGELPEVIYASTERDDEAESRTFVEGKKVLWHKGDTILYCNNKFQGAKYVFRNGEDGASSAEFEKLTNGDPSDTTARFSLGVYPYHKETYPHLVFDEEKGAQAWKITAQYPCEQYYLPNSFGRGANLMIATDNDPESDHLAFRNICGYLVVKLYGVNVRIKNLQLRAYANWNIALNGKRTIHVYEDGEIKFGDWTHTQYDPNNFLLLHCDGVKISEDKDNPSEFWFALPPMTIEGGIRLRIEDTNGQVIVKETSKDIVIERNKIQPMAALDVTNQSRLTQLWYTTEDNQPLELDNAEAYFNAPIIRHERARYASDDFRYLIESEQPLTEIKGGAFKDAKLTSVVLPDGLETIGESAFENTTLTSLFIPDRVTTIGNKAFKNAAIAEINLPEGVASIGDEAFLGTKLSTIAFPASLKTIGASAFKNTPLSTLTLPYAIETIKQNAFENTQISSITLPGSLTWLGYNAFSYCPNLKTVTFLPSATNTPLKLDAPVGSNSDYRYSPFYNNNQSETDMDEEEIAENRARSLQSVTLNRELVKAHDEVSMGLFFLHTALTNLTIGEQVKTIGSFMFSYSGLTSVELPSNVTSVEERAFIDCKNLTTLTAYGKLHIGHSAFAGCTLQTVNLNGGVNGIERAGFAGCKLTSFYMNETTSSGAIAERAFENSKIPALTIPGGITSIGDEAFLRCTNLKRISFLAGTTPLEMGFDEGYIAAYQGEHGLFYECPLTEIFVDRDMTFTEEYADAMDEADEGIFSYEFYDNDTHKTTVTLGQNIKTIPLRMFSNSAITSLTIPANVTKIEEWAFDNCLKLTSVTIEQGTTPLTIGYNMYGILEYGTFYDCPLSYVYCGRDIVQVDDEDEVSPADGWEEGVFANKYDKLTAINLGGKLTKILPYMFADTEATGVWIPNIITSIGDYAFDDCDKLLTITMGYDGKTQFPTIGTDVFSGCSNTVKIKVRPEVYNDFLKHAEEGNYGWGDYGSRIITGPFN